MPKAGGGALKRAIWKGVYNYLARSLKHQDWTFMNYGYAPPESDPVLELSPSDEPDRYSIQLYRHVAGAVDLRGKDVLEVGSGRGGGAAYVRQALAPSTMTGIDFSGEAVDLCRKRHVQEGLRFVEGSADAIPFPDESFDAVVNVESSHCYGPLEGFLSEVVRVLRPGGYFLFADFRSREILDDLRNDLTSSGLGLVSETVITPNVFRALELDNVRRRRLIDERLGASLRSKAFDRFAAMEGSGMYEKFRTGAKEYISVVMRKV